MKRSPDRLDAATYQQLAKPSEKVPVTYYSGVEPDLFDSIIAKYANGGHHGTANAASAAGE